MSKDGEPIVPSSVSELEEILGEFGVNTWNWGQDQAKSVDDLFEAIRTQMLTCLAGSNEEIGRFLALWGASIEILVYHRTHDGKYLMLRENRPCIPPSVVRRREKDKKLFPDIGCFRKDVHTQGKEAHKKLAIIGIQALSDAEIDFIGEGVLVGDTVFEEGPNEIEYPGIYMFRRIFRFVLGVSAQLFDQTKRTFEAQPEDSRRFSWVEMPADE